VKKRIGLVCGIVILIVLVLVGFHYYNIPTVCMFHELTGLYCVGCGLTRATKSLMRLEFYQAFRYNVLMTPLIIPILCLLFVSTIQYIKGVDIDDVLILKVIVKIWPIIVFFILGFMILRNIIPELAPVRIY